MTFPNQYYKVNYICMLTMLQLLSLVQFKQVDSSYRQIGSDDLAEEYFCWAPTSCSMWKHCS